MDKSDGEKATELLEKKELEDLRPCALRSKERREQLKLRFREYKLKSPLEYRTEYHRDRDRIVWSRAFKRLQHKTQVFPHYVEDHYRRRLTHTLEVAQIATTLARALKLNETACEAIAFGHDLGHAPFGHAGEIALNEILRDRGPTGKRRIDLPVPLFGFDHCVHGIEVVSRIERDYKKPPNGEHYGLNLTFDVRDGILKHMFERKRDPKRPLSTIGQAVNFEALAEFEDNKGSLEAQCVYFADKMAYLLGDIEDGIRRGIFKGAQLEEDEFIKCVWKKYKKARNRIDCKPTLSDVDAFLFYRRAAITAMILNCTHTTKAKITKLKIRSIEDVLNCPERIVYVNEAIGEKWTSFHEKWMVGRLFKNKNVKASEVKARKIVEDLFKAYMDTEELIDEEYRKDTKESYHRLGITDPCTLKLITARNYIAGMTDPFATNQHARLFMSSERISFS